MGQKYIKLCFSGFLTGIPIKTVIDNTINFGEEIDVANIPMKTLIKNLNSGDWLISFEECLRIACDGDTEIFDIEEDPE